MVTSEQPIKDKTAIVGIGWTNFTKSSGSSVLQLALEASLNAIADAGLEAADIDGVITSCYGTEWERQAYPKEVVAGLGLRQCNYQMFEILGGSQSCSYVAAAAMAVYSGLCKNVLVFRALNRFSDRAVRGVTPARGLRQWRAPFGSIHAAAGFGMPVVAHMARYGTTTEDFARIAVAQRAHAGLNKKAMMRDPISIEDHQASSWVIYPYRLLDCCLNTDGAVALIVTSAERARDLRHSPVHIMSVMGGALDGQAPWETNAQAAAPRLYAGAGITVNDIDFAELYDPFTGMCLLHMEGYGLAEPGGAAAWIKAGGNGLDGDTPVNTHGGLLSEAYVHGLNHVIEAVQQLRTGGVVDDYCDGEHDYDRSHCRQVKDPMIGLVCGEFGHSSLILRRG